MTPYTINTPSPPVVGYITFGPIQIHLEKKPNLFRRIIMRYIMGWTWTNKEN